MTRGLRSFRVRAAVPGITVRLLILAIVWGGAVVLVPFPLWQGVAVVAALVAVALPRSLAAWFGAACLCMVAAVVSATITRKKQVALAS